MPKSVMNPTRLAIEMTGAVYAPAPNNAAKFMNGFGDSVRKIARMPPMRASGRFTSTSSDTRSDPIARLSSRTMMSTTTPLKSVMVWLADCCASNCPPYLTV